MPSPGPEQNLVGKCNIGVWLKIMGLGSWLSAISNVILTAVLPKHLMLPIVTTFVKMKIQSTKGGLVLVRFEKQKPKHLLINISHLFISFCCQAKLKSHLADFHTPLEV